VADEPAISIRQLQKPELPPWIHQLRRPITSATLGSLDPRCRIVQFAEPLNPDELEAVSALLREHPGVGLRVYGFGRGPYSTLDFLEHFPSLEHVQIECYDLQDISGLRFLRPELKRLSFGQTRKRFSLAPLGRFTQLERLWLYGHTKDIEVLRRLKRLRRLSLRGITLPNLHLLTALERLEILLAIDMRQLAPEHFRPFVGHPSLVEAGIGLGSKKKKCRRRRAARPAASVRPAELD
jgi:hypothetical protein